MNLYNENEAYVDLLCGHLIPLVRRLRGIPPDRWDWQPEITAPSARTLATHTWQWLICDRQHIREPDASQHPRVPDPPTDQKGICDALAEEMENWRTLILSLTPEQLSESRMQFNCPEPRYTVRGFVGHIVQNTIYKHGQVSTIYFMLGLDGTEPYTAPFPNPIYDEEFGQTAAFS